MNRRTLAAAALAAAAACVGPPGGSSGGRDGGGLGGASGAGGGIGGAAGAAGFIGQPCAEIDETTRMLPPEVLILLDASGSMNENIAGLPCDGDCGATSKRAQASAAIDGVVADSATTVSWGLKWFPDGGGACGVNATVAVPVAAGNGVAVSDAIASRMAANGGIANEGSTPTRLAVQSGSNYLGGLGGGNRKLLLLITDGAPNCMPGNADTAADDAPAAVRAIADAAALGVPTIVVGLATAGGPADATLNDMARAGGLARAAGPPFYYPAASAGELTDTLRGLVKTTATCVFALPPPPNSATTPASIGVRAGGVDLPRDTSHTSGWDYSDGTWTAVQIYGPACDDVLAGNIQTVSIVFFCGDPS